MKKVYELSVAGLYYVENMDRLNLHWLLELTRRTDPLYNYTRHVSYIFFEKKHRALKRSFERTRKGQL